MAQPLYLALADRLASQIAEGEFAVGSRFPTELELSTRTGMARGTIREALRCLEEAGMISRSRAGTTVLANRPLDAYHPSAGTPDQIMDLVRKTKLIHPVQTRITVDTELAERLQVPNRSRWHKLAGRLVLRSDPKTTVCWSEHYLSTLKSLETFRSGSYGLGSFASLPYQQDISAEPLEPEIARALDGEPGEPALIVRRRHLRADGTVQKVSVYTHVGRWFRITSMHDPGADDGGTP